MSKRESPFTFRMATLEDLDTCVSLAMQIPLENDAQVFPKVSEDKVAERLRESIEKQGVVLYEHSGITIGLLAVIIDSFWFSEEPHMITQLIYIKKEFRSFGNLRRLLSCAEEFAKINNMPLAMIMFVTKDVDRKYNMAIRRGYKPIGFWTIKKRD